MRAVLLLLPRRRQETEVAILRHGATAFKNTAREEPGRKGR